MAVLKITQENFEEEVSKSNIPVIIDFYADWCGPCKMMSPIIDNIAEELGESVKVGKVNIDDNKNLAMQFGIMSIPTVIIFKEGKGEKTFVGLRDKEEILNGLK